MRKAKEKTRQLLIHSSVTRVLVFASSIAILLVISLTFIANRVYADIITKEIFSTHKANLSFAQAHVEETLGKFSAINWFLLSDRDVVAFSQTSDKQLSWEGKMLYDKINALSESNILKNRITLLFNNPNKVIISDYGIFTPEIENDLSFFSHQEGNSVSNNMWYLSFTQNIPELIYRNTLVDSKGMEYAVCEIAIPVDEIGKIITRITADKNLAPFFLEGNTIALIKSHNTKLQVFEKKFTVPTPFTTVEEFLQGWNTQSSEYLQIKSSLEILTESIAFSQCKIGIVFDKDIALSPVSYANKIPLVLLVPLLLLGLTIALFVNRNIVRPLHNLVEPMKSMVESEIGRAHV